MTHDLVRGLILVAGLLPYFAGAAAERQHSSVTQLDWLTGCWESRRGGRRIEEQWMRPDGGAMLGMSRTLIGTRTTEFEFMHIREQEGRLVFTARPLGQEEASFASVELTESKVVFENASHDFPQRITYRRAGDGSLSASIEGEQGGELRVVDFPMRRTKCAEGVGR